MSDSTNYDGQIIKLTKEFGDVMLCRTDKRSEVYSAMSLKEGHLIGENIPSNKVRQAIENVGAGNPQRAILIFSREY